MAAPLGILSTAITDFVEPTWIIQSYYFPPFKNSTTTPNTITLFYCFVSQYRERILCQEKGNSGQLQTLPSRMLLRKTYSARRKKKTPPWHKLSFVVVWEILLRCQIGLASPSSCQAMDVSYHRLFPIGNLSAVYTVNVNGFSLSNQAVCMVPLSVVSEAPCEQ